MYKQGHEVMRLIRSLLFAPANRPEMLRKFPRYPADAVAIDLEDGTPENEKADAREHLPDIVAYLREQRLAAMLFVRTMDRDLITLRQTRPWRRRT